MGVLDRLKRALGGPGSRGSGGGGASFGGQEPNTYWIYARCRRCGEPLKGRVNLANDLSQADDGEGWIVRKGLIGSGANRCFQTVEVTLRFDARKEKVVESQVTGGTLITEDQYEALLRGTNREAA